ncbi:hypothetical protein BJ170DRAFT_599424 [Xylariales sp. AK1849]|nr:hypothetical protein BJ170DRAFT_599424 [Xylariales sp. AK1849]
MSGMSSSSPRSKVNADTNIDNTYGKGVLQNRPTLRRIMTGIFGVICAIACPETYGPVILERKAAKLRKELYNPIMYRSGFWFTGRLPFLSDALFTAGRLEKGFTVPFPSSQQASFGFGAFFAFHSVQTYMIDAYTKYAASAIAARSVLRSLAGALLRIAGLPMYERLGFGCGNSLRAFILMGLGALPLLFMKNGEGLQNKFPLDLAGILSTKTCDSGAQWSMENASQIGTGSGGSLKCKQMRLPVDNTMRNL